MARHFHLNPYDYHKYLINQYVLKKPGDTRNLNEFASNTNLEFKTDRDRALANLKFIWNEEDKPKNWEERLAKKYYDKLFREYCICDLSRFKENKIANRFRVEKEVINGKGQFICGEKACKTEEGLKTWEVNFNYMENQERKNALVKISKR
jgi:protein FRA10AC1